MGNRDIFGNKKNNYFLMKKAGFLAFTLFIGILSFVSCRKEYHCHCSYNNNVVYSADLGNQTKSNAEKACNVYDSTITGEVWNCTIY